MLQNYMEGVSIMDNIKESIKPELNIALFKIPCGQYLSIIKKDSLSFIPDTYNAFAVDPELATDFILTLQEHYTGDFLNKIEIEFANISAVHGQPTCEVKLFESYQDSLNKFYKS